MKLKIEEIEEKVLRRERYLKVGGSDSPCQWAMTMLMMTNMWVMTGRKGMTGLTRITTYKVDKYDNNSTAGDTRGVAAVDDMIGYDVAVYDGYVGVGKDDSDD